MATPQPIVIQHTIRPRVPVYQSCLRVGMLTPAHIVSAHVDGQWRHAVTIAGQTHYVFAGVCSCASGRFCLHVRAANQADVPWTLRRITYLRRTWGSFDDRAEADTIEANMTMTAVPSPIAERLGVAQNQPQAEVA